VPPIFGRAAITLGIGRHSSFFMEFHGLFYVIVQDVQVVSVYILRQLLLYCDLATHLSLYMIGPDAG